MAGVVKIRTTSAWRWSPHVLQYLVLLFCLSMMNFEEVTLCCCFCPVQNVLLVLLAPNVDETAFPTPVGDLLKAGEVIWSELTIAIGFDNYTSSQILDSVLPDGVPRISSFATIGHIAHVNLKSKHLPFRQLIGKSVYVTMNQCLWPVPVPFFIGISRQPVPLPEFSVTVSFLTDQHSCFLRCWMAHVY